MLDSRITTRFQSFCVILTKRVFFKNWTRTCQRNFLQVWIWNIRVYFTVATTWDKYCTILRTISMFYVPRWTWLQVHFQGTVFCVFYQSSKQYCHILNVPLPLVVYQTKVHSKRRLHTFSCKKLKMLALSIKAKIPSNIQIPKWDFSCSTVLASVFCVCYRYI